jgi:protein TonB
MGSDCAPTYPENARRRGQQGRVVIQVNVSAEGRALSASVAQSSGFASLDTAALTAVERCRFDPATRGGAPVAWVYTLPVLFRLTD